MDDQPPMRKFMFDRSFDDSLGARTQMRRPVTLTAEQLDTLKKEVHDAAFAAGKKSGIEEQEKRLGATVAQIEGHIGRLLEQTAAERPQREARLREAVLAIARKVLPDFSQRHGLQEIEAVVAGIIGEMTGEPRLVVRVNEGQFDAVDASLKSVTEKQGYAGKIVLLADAEVKANDCRVEWADGGIERNVEALWKNIGKTLAPDVAPMESPTTQSTDQTPVSSDAAG